MLRVLVHYSEIALKGKNRSFFEQKLMQNCVRVLKPHTDRVRSQRLGGRILLEASGKREDDSTLPTIINKVLSRLFGVAYAAFAFEYKGKTIEGLAQEILAALKQHDLARRESFKIDTLRSDKAFPLTSKEVNERIGSALGAFLKKPVSLDSPALTISIEIVPSRRIFYWFEKFKGPGGLPTTSAGRVVSLLSGGIDSPVASWRVMKRGAKVIFAHFHAYPYTNKSSQENVRAIATTLSEWQQGGVLYLIPFSNVQAHIIALASPKLRLILYRRAMMMIAHMLAGKVRAQALVTGESLGQVASQTLENIRVIDEASSLPIFRPLIGNDKEETIVAAKMIGTYDISIRPHEDCCSFLASKHPETKAVLADVLKEERRLSHAPLLQKSLDASEIIALT